MNKLNWFSVEAVCDIETMMNSAEYSTVLKRYSHQISQKIRKSM